MLSAGVQMRDCSGLDHRAGCGGREGGVCEGSENVKWAGIGSGHMAGEEGSSQHGARVPGLCRWVAGWLPAGTWGRWVRTGQAWRIAHGEAGAELLLHHSPAMKTAAISLTSRGSCPSFAE